jgi:glycosyltransferase involved in cell wall biosynthesis
MGSQQNILAFNRFYNNIWPEILNKLPDSRMIVVGNNPPESIKKLHDNNQIIVTGFVEDVRPWLSKAQLMILPMEIGSGFRGRVVEVMAMGIPVVGTHNALDSVEIETGVHGCISDDNEVLIDYCVQLLTDHEFRLNNSDACRQLAIEKYSIEATFGRFAEYLRDFKTN